MRSTVQSSTKQCTNDLIIYIEQNIASIQNVLLHTYRCYTESSTYGVHITKVLLDNCSSLAVLYNSIDAISLI